MKGLILSYVRRNAKAIAAFVVAAGVSALVKAGIGIPSDVAIAAEALVIACIVWLIPNEA